MQLQSSLITLATLAGLLGSTSAAAITKRDTLASFTLSYDDKCGDSYARVDVLDGNACGQCTWAPGRSPSSQKTPGIVPLSSIQMLKKDPRCQVILFQTPDCSDPGADAGPGACWNPDGRVHSYKVYCPSYPGGCSAGTVL